MNQRYYVDTKGFEIDNRRYNAEDVLSFPNKNVKQLLLFGFYDNGLIYGDHRYGCGFYTITFDRDENGNWIQVPFIKVREAKDRFLYGSHGANSKYIAESFIPLTTEEAAAILNHMGGKESSAVTLDGDLSGIYNRYQLALYLHVADMLATFHDEKLF